MTYTVFMVVGIDNGVLCCEDCGALVPSDWQVVHEAHHAQLARLERREAQR